MVRFAWLAWLAGAAGAQDVALTGPSLGLLVDSETLAVRRIMGLPGAAWLSAPLDLGAKLSLAVASPRGDYVLGVEAESGRLLLLRPGVEPAGAPGGASAERVLVSPSGACAAVSAAGRLQVLTGLPSQPRLAWEAETTAKTLAVSDDGAVLAAGDSLVRLTQEGADVVVPDRVASAAAFLPGSRAALVAFEDEVQYFRGTEVQIVAQVEKPAAVAGSADGRRAFIAHGNAITVAELGGGVPVTIACDCTPTGLARLAGNVFRLTSTGVIRLLDADGAEPRVVFVPAAN